MRILGLDYGTKRIGVAVSDALKLTAQPLNYFPNDQKIFSKISELISEYEVTKIIIGNPKHMSGEESQKSTEVKKFVQNYRPTEGDNLRIIDILINPQVYETLRLLRTAIVTKNDLEKLRKKGVDDLDDVLKMLWNTQMIQVFQDERNNEYYALLSDFYMDLIFPKYLLNIIKNVYDQKSKSNQVLIEYLTVLENSYTDIKATIKAEAKAKVKV